MTSTPLASLDSAGHVSTSLVATSGESKTETLTVDMPVLARRENWRADPVRGRWDANAGHCKCSAAARTRTSGTRVRAAVVQVPRHAGSRLPGRGEPVRLRGARRLIADRTPRRARTPKAPALRPKKPPPATSDNVCYVQFRLCDSPGIRGFCNSTDPLTFRNIASRGGLVCGVQQAELWPLAATGWTSLRRGSPGRLRRGPTGAGRRSCRPSD